MKYDKYYEGGADGPDSRKKNDAERKQEKYSEEL
jgi:hypothetical protein